MFSFLSTERLHCRPSTFLLPNAFSACPALSATCHGKPHLPNPLAIWFPCRVGLGEVPAGTGRAGTGGKPDYPPSSISTTGAAPPRGPPRTLVIPPPTPILLQPRGGGRLPVAADLWVDTPSSWWLLLHPLHAHFPIVGSLQKAWSSSPGQSSTHGLQKDAVPCDSAKTLPDAHSPNPPTILPL